MRRVAVGGEFGPVKMSVAVAGAGMTGLMLAGDSEQEEIEVAGVDVGDCCQGESWKEYALLNVSGALKAKGVDGVLKLDGG